MDKTYLLTPGPTPVPPETLLEMARPVIHHRENEFRTLLGQCREGLRYLFQTRRDVLVLASSGTGAMEAAVTNFLRRGDKALYVNGGKFGERWGKILTAYGCQGVEVPVAWGQAVDPEEVRRALDADPGIRAVYVQATETSTAVRHPVGALAAITRERADVLLVVDGITAVGVFDLPMDALGIDVLLTASQKALMLPPGLAFIAWSEKAEGFLEAADLPRFYFDLATEREKQADNQTAWTPAVTLIVGLRDVLGRIREETLAGVFRRTAKLAGATRAGVLALGLRLFAPDHPSDACTAACMPDGIDGREVMKILRERFGVIVAGGQDQAQGKILRIAHMGTVDDIQVITAITTLEYALRKVGHPARLGSGVRAVLEFLGASSARFIVE
ncbi:MAG: alanine--glyoxylate aminotransferase family protein [Deferrisomatales bacterium]|nr:alanine--glyoxylate aminotransferase family protein [Deferrisomatales bacterium]